MEIEEWCDLDTQEEQIELPPATYQPNKYLSYRFNTLAVEEVTVENYKEKLVASIYTGLCHLK